MKPLKPNETITEDRYRLQLMHLSRALKEKRPLYEQRHDKVILQHDNARRHVAQPVKLGTWKHLNMKSYSTRRIHQTLRLPIIPCSDR